MAPHQQYYEVLGLDAPPEDRKTVKRAYSKKLKVTRPEDDPDGFMRLRDAHDIALNIIARQAAQAAWEIENDFVRPPIEPEPVTQTPLDTASEGPPADMEPSLTYEDMLPSEPQIAEAPPVEDTSYSIGPTPSFDAPVTHFETEAPKPPPLTDDLDTLLSDPKHYNDRENWNQLFRKARQLDIDDYVDFEHLLMDAILHFHGFYAQHDDYDNPEKMPQKFSPSITASLFKTMSWDQVNTQGHHRAHQIEWLSRRMRVHQRSAEPVPIPQPESGGAGNVWMWIFGAFILLKIIQLMANI